LSISLSSKWGDIGTATSTKLKIDNYFFYVDW
jgi:hypothetical protein